MSTAALRVVNADALHVRRQPSLSASSIGLLTRDALVECEISDGDWWRVKGLHSHATYRGWCSRTYLSPLPSTNETRILEVAASQLGQSELHGPRANPSIVRYLRTTILPDAYAEVDETAWCSAFVNWCVETAGFRGTGSASAASWLRWGEEAPHILRGCVVLLRRHGGSGYHVGFFIRQQATVIDVLGGNQEDRVSIRSYAIERLVASRVWGEISSPIATQRRV